LVFSDSGGACVADSAAWSAVLSWVGAAPGKSQFAKDHAQWSAFGGKAKPMAEATKRMAQLPVSKL